MKRLPYSLSLILLAVCSSLQFSHATEIIAHRGYSSIAPENTLASMKAAWKRKG